MQSTPRIAHDGPPAVAEAAAVRDAALAHHIEALEAQREVVAQLGDAKRKRAADARAQFHRKNAGLLARITGRPANPNQEK